MQYPFPPIRTYNNMSQGQLGQAYANLEHHYGPRAYLPAPFDRRPYLNNEHQHAASHMDILQYRIANYAKLAELRAEHLANEKAREEAWRKRREEAAARGKTHPAPGAQPAPFRTHMQPVLHNDNHHELYGPLQITQPDPIYEMPPLMPPPHLPLGPYLLATNNNNTAFTPPSPAMLDSLDQEHARYDEMIARQNYENHIRGASAGAQELYAGWSDHQRGLAATLFQARHFATIGHD